MDVGPADGDQKTEASFRAGSGPKAFTAHPLGATGAMETAICALALSEGFIPPTLRHRIPDPACESM